MDAPVVIIGGGLAAGTAVTELREQGYGGELVVLAEEAYPPYERPPLSKGLLQGRKTPESAEVHPAEWYAEQGVDLRTSTRAAWLDTERHTVTTQAAEMVEYSSLLIATGARARRLAFEPRKGLAVRYLRTLDDALALRDGLGEGRRLLVVGGGWLGLEVAASARQLGTAVTLVEPAEQPLAGTLGPEVGARFAEVHRAHGVDLRTGTQVDHLNGGTVFLTDGTELEVDTVFVAVGAVPNDDLARAAGLEVDRGILVDPGLRTSAPDVFAAGDVANAEHPGLGERIRVEHWQNAISQGRAAAHALLGEPVRFADLPYFFTDQYDLGMEYFGHVGAAGFDRLDVEEGEEGSFAAFWHRGDRLLAAMHVNQWDRSDELKERVGQQLHAHR